MYSIKCQFIANCLYRILLLLLLHIFYVLVLYRCNSVIFQVYLLCVSFMYMYLNLPVFFCDFIHYYLFIMNYF